MLTSWPEATEKIRMSGGIAAATRVASLEKTALETALTFPRFASICPFERFQSLKSPSPLRPIAINWLADVKAVAEIDSGFSGGQTGSSVVARSHSLIR